MSDVLRALLFLEQRTLRRRVVSWARSPIAWATLLLVLASAAWAWVLSTPEDWDLTQDSQRVAAVGSLVLGMAVCVSGWTSTLQSPVVVSMADASWVLVRPEGGRAFVLHRILMAAVTTSLLSVPSAVASVALFHLPVSRIGIVVVAASLSAMAIRLAGYATRVLYLHGVALRFLRFAWSLAAVWTVGSGAVRAVRAEEPPRWDLLGQLLWALASAFARPDVRWLELGAVAVMVVGVVVLVVRHCAGFEEEAIDVANQVASLMTAVVGGRGGGSALDELVNKSLRKGVSSLAPVETLRCERAFLWRALAQYRRQTRPWQLVAHFLALLVIAVAVARFAPRELVTLPFLVSSLSGVLAGCSRGLAEEMGRVHFWAAPGSLAKKVWWAMVVQLVENASTGFVTGVAVALAAPELRVAARVELVAMGVGAGLLTTAVVCAVSTLRASLLDRVIVAFPLLAMALTAVSMPLGAGWNLPLGVVGVTAVFLGTTGVAAAWALAVFWPRSSHDFPRVGAMGPTSSMEKAS